MEGMSCFLSLCFQLISLYRAWILHAHWLVMAQVGARPNELLHVLLLSLCALRMKPVDAVFVFDGPELPTRKSGPFVKPFPSDIITAFKGLITAMGFSVRGVRQDVTPFDCLALITYF